MKSITLILYVCLATILMTGAVVLTGCTSERITATQTETITATKTTTLLPQPTIPNQIAQDVTVGEAYAMIQNNADNPEFAILDVRTPEEYAEGYIEGAILIDKRSDTWLAEIEALDRCATYLVY